MPTLRRVFAAVALALVIAPLVTNAPLFDPDEGLHAAIAQEMAASGDYVTPRFLGRPFLDKPILFFWTEAVSLRVFGQNEFAVRVPPLLFGLAGMLSVALLGRALFGAAAGLISGIAYGTMLLPLGVSQVAVHDIGLVPFVCVACWCLARIAASNTNGVASAFTPSNATGVVSAFRRNDVAPAVVAGVVLGLSILTKGLSGCVFATIFAGCLAAGRREAIPRLAVALVVAGIVSILVALPWYIAMERAHSGYLHYYFVERHVQGYLTATQRHAGRPWWYYLPIVAGGALPWTVYVFAAPQRDRMRLAMWAWFTIGLVFLSAGESKLVTYALPLFPALALLVGDSIARYDGTRRAIHRAALATMAVCIAGIPVGGLIELGRRYGESHANLWLPVGVCAAAGLYCVWRATRSAGAPALTSWLAAAAVASIIGMMVVMRPAAAWMTARDLASALNADGRLPPRVSVVDERIGSLVFYLAPPLRAEASPERLVETSFTEALSRVRIDDDETIVAVRVGQMDRFRRLFPALPAPDQQAGTFVLYRGRTLKQAIR